MPTGPGKYDDVATLARTEAEAVAVILCVIEGKHGNGFSVQSLEPDLLPNLPALLRVMADEIERSMRGGNG